MPSSSGGRLSEVIMNGDTLRCQDAEIDDAVVSSAFYTVQPLGGFNVHKACSVCVYLHLLVINAD